jgi:hypothetical protein
MKIRPWARCVSDLPSDHVEDEFQIVQLGGKGVASTIGEILRDLGYKVSEPVSANDNGWEIYVLAAKPRRRLWCQVTFMDDHYLLFFGQNSWIAEFFGKCHPAYVDALSRLAAALADDARFREIRWFTSDELYTEATGASCPVEV